MNRKHFSILLTAIVALAWSTMVFAGESETASHTADWAKALGAALGIGLAAVGGAMGQGRAAAAALEGIARNPNATKDIFNPMILSLALIESLVIYALIIAFLLLP